MCGKGLRDLRAQPDRECVVFLCMSGEMVIRGRVDLEFFHKQYCLHLEIHHGDLMYVLSLSLSFSLFLSLSFSLLAW